MPAMTEKHPYHEKILGALYDAVNTMDGVYLGQYEDGDAYREQINRAADAAFEILFPTSLRTYYVTINGTNGYIEVFDTAEDRQRDVNAVIISALESGNGFCEITTAEVDLAEMDLDDARWVVQNLLRNESKVITNKSTIVLTN
jgi:hypothetical protein